MPLDISEKEELILQINTADVIRRIYVLKYSMTKQTFKKKDPPST